jgi:DNA helicase-2/ATP-dependent DNA helicase PcrA
LTKVYSLSVNTSRIVADLIEENYPHFYEQLDRILDIQKIYNDYKRKNNLLDYDDLLVYLRNFLEELGPWARSLLSTIKFVMVDEYQDTNKLQADIVMDSSLNNKHNVVGDDCRQFILSGC